MINSKATSSLLKYQWKGAFSARQWSPSHSSHWRSLCGSSFSKHATSQDRLWRRRWTPCCRSLHAYRILEALLQWASNKHTPSSSHMQRSPSIGNVTVVVTFAMYSCAQMDRCLLALRSFDIVHSSDVSLMCRLTLELIPYKPRQERSNRWSSSSFPKHFSCIIFCVKWWNKCN